VLLPQVAGLGLTQAGLLAGLLLPLTAALAVVQEGGLELPATSPEELVSLAMMAGLLLKRAAVVAVAWEPLAKTELIMEQEEPLVMAVQGLRILYRAQMFAAVAVVAVRVLAPEPLRTGLALVGLTQQELLAQPILVVAQVVAVETAVQDQQAGQVSCTLGQH
tara:strand:+ start:276 stop:764 length:489 start_codon:yes stop_codon:yes gene_type:complete